MEKKLSHLASILNGDLHFDSLMRALYATDASVYRELPLAVALPKNAEDIKKLIAFATENKTSLIPRTAGTSLAGQCVGSGIVVDVSKYMNAILEINENDHWVRVQPGVIRDELNFHLKKYGLFFGPDTSTANRCMIGGMVGNNSCGTTSIKYGTTRDHVLELKTILSDGSEAVFKKLNKKELNAKLNGNLLEHKIYQQLFNSLSKKEIQLEIKKEFPKENIHRRNTGYAVDVLLHAEPFLENGEPFNMCKLLAGSEGTLAFTTEIKLNVSPLPPKEKIVVCPHFHSLQESLEAVLIAMRYEPYACELMDKIILDCTKENIEQQKNRFFLEGDPESVLMIQFNADHIMDAEIIANKMIAEMQAAGYGYAFPKVMGSNIEKVWDLRKAGLGVLANIPGEKKAVACIEDTAVDIQDLPKYISEFSKMMEAFGQRSVYYAHAGAGELHLRPILDLKKKKDVDLFREITAATARLVKKYNGSLSGEHGDGRVRAEFLPIMIGDKNYELLKEIKRTWDPQNIFNPGKITDAAPMDTSLRYEPEIKIKEPKTIFDFSAEGGLLQAAEKCNGSGDCRRLSLSGGTMCPSYRASRNEKDTTRARANALREFLTRNANDKNPFAHPELKEVMDLCLSCKGCTSECPSNVDMATMKAEFLFQYQKKYGVPFRSRVFANIAQLNKWGMITPNMTNFFLGNKFTSNIIKNILGVSADRSLPKLNKISLVNWFKKNKTNLKIKGNKKGELYFFCDEFTNYNDTTIGIKTVQLLTRLGYQINMITHPESGRAHISKGLLTEAQILAKKNVAIFKNVISEKIPLVGIEPSAILSFRDEYPKLVEKEMKDIAIALGKNTLMVEEFLAKEIEKGNITSEHFSDTKQQILLHGHCHQKALSSVEHSAFILSLPKNNMIEIIPSGCCGMAGSFGYEKEHYQMSMQVGELVLFPAVRKATDKTVIVAPGTSCRHQIWDGTGRKAFHPIEVLMEQLI
ncbi:MAG: FAD-linked oxidase C-terminal domain-containing protein [Saprospiraceae bacterium]